MKALQAMFALAVGTACAALEISGLLFVMFLAGLIYEAKAADLACAQEGDLLVVLEQGVPVDEIGRPLVGCSVWVADHPVSMVDVYHIDMSYNETIEWGDGQTRVWLTQNFSTVITRVTDGKKVFYVIIDYFVEPFTDTFLPFGSPCEFTACEETEEPKPKPPTRRQAPSKVLAGIPPIT